MENHTRLLWFSIGWKEPFWMPKEAPYFSPAPPARKSLFRCKILAQPREGALPIMDYKGRLRPKGVSFLGWRYIKGQDFKS